MGLLRTAVAVAAVLLTASAAPVPEPLWNLASISATCPKGKSITRFTANVKAPSLPATAASGFTATFGIGTGNGPDTNTNGISGFLGLNAADEWEMGINSFSPAAANSSIPAPVKAGEQVAAVIVPYEDGFAASTVAGKQVSELSGADARPGANMTTATLFLGVRGYHVPCSAYPPSELLSFTDLAVECSGVATPMWWMGVNVEVCGVKAPGEFFKDHAHFAWNTSATK